MYLSISDIAWPLLNISFTLTFFSSVWQTNWGKGIKLSHKRNKKYCQRHISLYLYYYVSTCIAYIEVYYLTTNLACNWMAQRSLRGNYEWWSTPSPARFMVTPTYGTSSHKKRRKWVWEMWNSVKVRGKFEIKEMIEWNYTSIQRQSPAWYLCNWVAAHRQCKLVVEKISESAFETDL